MRSFRSALTVAILFRFVLGSPAADIDFAHTIVPILKQHCVACHGGEKAKGGFSVNTRELFLEDDMAVPGDAANSEFLRLIQSKDTDDQMPPEDKPRVPAESIKVLKQWVNEGMKWEAGFSFDESRYEPPLKPRTPRLPEIIGGRNNPIDRILDHWLKEKGLPTPGPVDDHTFIRRAYLDLVGLLPTPEELEHFISDTSPDKRTRLIDQLLNDDVAYADHWLSFWNDLLRNDYTGTGFITGGRKQVTSWLYEALVQNKPFTQFVRELISPPSEASKGFIDGIKWRGEVSAGQTVEIQFAQSISQTFLGINMKCASCHDSFIDRWKLEEAYGLAAIYSEQPLEIHRCDKPIGKTAKASWLFPEIGQIDPELPPAERLRQLADLMVHPENGRTTRTIVNRLWAQLMGRGIVHPLDAMQTPPWNADLLDFLASHLSAKNHDLKSVLRLIATSEAYQSVSEALETQEDKEYTYRGPRARRLTAEQFVDAVWQMTGSAPRTHESSIIRGRMDVAPGLGPKLKAKWIWGDSMKEGSTSPAGEEILLQKVFELKGDVANATAVMTVDNSFSFHLNGKQLAKGDNWGEVKVISLLGSLKQGKNTLMLKARNAGNSPNSAGALFEARIILADGSELTIATDESWRWKPGLPKDKKIDPSKPEPKWAKATTIKALSAWTSQVDKQARVYLAVGASSVDIMVRASLLKSDFLMRSLGRPMREQIVSSRPSEISTLEAIDLYNSPELTGYLKTGAENLASSKGDSVKEITEHLFEFALARKPTKTEQEIIGEVIGEKANAEAIQDLLWSIIMKPEFMIIR